MATRMTSYMTDNNYVDTSVQKGGVPGFSRCIENTRVISQLIQEAKVNKKDLKVVWLDLANAYGTIPHMLIQRVHGRFITTDTHVHARWVLKALEVTVTWERMAFKQMKSRSLIIRKGRRIHKVELKMQGEVIPSIIDNPIKCLGKGFDDSLSDKNNIRRIEQVSEGMRNIDRTGLPVRSLKEPTINRHIRKWLGVQPSFTSVGLYSRTAKLQLPSTSIMSIEEQFKVGKTRLGMTLKESRDDKVRTSGVKVRTGRSGQPPLLYFQNAISLYHREDKHSDTIKYSGNLLK
ncbi:unnamed protein product [Mytilus coruscus]|uniref:Reverse transcriptase domain-containing protein n=1 Tax=Mytilus coruscus TaxID=42192 RepID=A0A6J8D7J1_MYTCO|nr:unnamed protein product [Mytilus coruscus]